MKRVLIIAYFFPPVSNMGSHRMLRFVRHLQEFGWEPVVLTGKLTRGTQNDERLLARVPPDLDVQRIESVDLAELWAKLTRHDQAAQPTAATAPPTGPVKTQGVTTFLNRWAMIPDKFFPWIRPAAQAAERLIREKNIAAIYSTSDPLSDHLVALRLARRTRLPWVAEFRDLWLGSPYFARAHPTPLHRAIHAWLERRVVTGASAIVGLSRGIQRYFAETYPACRSRVIYNCFDPAEYEAPPEPAEKFTVAYTGALYSSRSPEPFMAGFAQFVKQQQLAAAAAEFVVIGGSPDLDLAAMAARHGLTEYVRLIGRVSHAEALRRMQAATLLLAVQSPEDDVHLPGKLFEYIGARRPILVVSQPCEIAEMIVNHKLGWVAEPNGAAVAVTLDEAYAAWKTRGHAGLTLAAADRFEIREATRQMAAQLDEVSQPT